MDLPRYGPGPKVPQVRVHRIAPAEPPCNPDGVYVLQSKRQPQIFAGQGRFTVRGPMVTRNTIYPDTFGFGNAASAGAYYLAGSVGWNFIREFLWKI